MNKTKAFALLIATIFVASTAGGLFYVYSGTNSPTGGDWTTFRGDYLNTGYNPLSTITSSNVANVKLAWQVLTTSGIASTPIVQNGVVYFADWSGIVYARSVTTGASIWQTKTGVKTSATLAVSNGLVYGAGSPDGPTPTAYALNQNTGKLVWKTKISNLPNLETDTSIWSSPIIYNGLVYVGIAGYSNVIHDVSKRGEIVALNAATGALVWNFTTEIGTSGGAGVWGTVAIDTSLNLLYLNTGSAYTDTSNTAYAYSVMALNPSTGKLAWVYQIYQFNDDKDLGSSPNLFLLPGSVPGLGIGGKDGIYYIFNRADGQLIRKFSFSTKPGQIIDVPSVVDTGNGNPEVFLAVGSEVVGLFPAQTTNASAISWKYTIAGKNVYGSITSIPGAIVFGDESGNLYALSSTNGHVLLKMSIPSSLRIDAGVTSAEGYLLVTAGQPGVNHPGGLFAYTA